MDVIMQMHPEGRSQDLEFYWRRYPGGFKIVRNQPQVECGLCLRLLVDKHQPTVLEFDRVGEVDIAHMMAEAGIYGRAYSYRCNRAVIISEYLVDVSPMYLEEDRPHLRACRLFTGVTFTPQGRPPSMRLPLYMRGNRQLEAYWKRLGPLIELDDYGLHS